MANQRGSLRSRRLTIGNIRNASTRPMINGVIAGNAFQISQPTTYSASSTSSQRAAVRQNTLHDGSVMTVGNAGACAAAGEDGDCTSGGSAEAVGSLVS